jgi:hypothetical protein
MNNKKAVLFTVITFLLISSLVLFVFAFIKRSELRNEIVIDSFNSVKFKKIENIISKNFLEIMKLDNNLRINYNNQKANVLFNVNLSNKNKDYNILLDNYLQFINNDGNKITYGLLSNLELFINLEPKFIIKPYNTLIEINKTKINISLNNINKIIINTSLNMFENTTEIQNNNFNQGDILLKLNVFDLNNENIFNYDSSIDNNLNSFYYLESNNTSPNKIFNVTIKDGFLYINVDNNMNSNINFDIEYDFDGKIYITTGLNSLLKTEKIIKNSSLLLLSS